MEDAGLKRVDSHGERSSRPVSLFRAPAVLRSETVSEYFFVLLSVISDVF